MIRNKSFLEISDYHEINASINEKQFFFESSSTKVKFLTEIFVDQIKHLVNEKQEFEKRHVSQNNCLRKIWKINFLMEGTE